MFQEQQHHERTRLSAVWVGVIVVCVLIAVAAYWPSPYVLERPGPVVNALGEIHTENGEVPVISISGAKVYETEGELQVLSVSLRGNPERPLSWLSSIPGFIDPTQRLVPIEEVFPEGTNAEQREAVNSALMQSSQVQSSAAALALLGIPVESEVHVASVSQTGAAHEILQPNDVVLDVNAVPVKSVVDIRTSLRGVEAGVQVPVTIERDGKRFEVFITPQLHASGDPLLGIEAAVQIDLPIEIEIEMDRIGGPSAGLTFALATFSMLSETDVLGGLVVSATGTMGLDGAVGPIGGLPQKIWGASRAGAELMLFPLANCADIPANVPEDLTLVPVETLQEAVNVIEEVRVGGSAVGLERCATTSS